MDPKFYGKTIRLNLYRKDVNTYYADRPGHEIRCTDFRATFYDLAYSHVVVFTDLDGTAYVLKNKVDHEHKSLVTDIELTRPQSFEFFGIKLPGRY